MIKAVCILSGGLDSCVTAYKMKKEFNFDMHFLTFNYGQKHLKEIEYAKQIAKDLESKIDVVNISDISSLVASSSLVGETEVPEGYYKEENMRSTVVQNRNAIMLSIAWGYACNIGAEYVGCGAHAGDHFIYPDCRPKFFESLETAFKLGTEGCGGEKLSFYTPFINDDKSVIIQEGEKLGVNWEKTWTCYKGQELPCGKCGSCDERIASFKKAGVKDTITYEGQ